MTVITKLPTADVVELRDGAHHALGRLGIDADSPIKARELLSAIDVYLSKMIANPTTLDLDIEALAFEFGCLWGEQLLSQLGWEWIRVEFNHQAPEAVGVSSADRSLVIYPFQTIFLYFERVLPIRVARSFEILSEPGRVPMLPSGGLENVMDHIE